MVLTHVIRDSLKAALSLLRILSKRQEGAKYLIQRLPHSEVIQKYKWSLGIYKYKVVLEYMVFGYPTSCANEVVVTYSLIQFERRWHLEELANCCVRGVVTGQRSGLGVKVRVRVTGQG